MPIDYSIDHARRLVVARGRGAFTETDLLAYQQEVWSRPEVAGFDEVVDMTDVEEIVAPLPAGPSLQHLAATAAAHDRPGMLGKLAIVAPTAIAFGLGRAYQTYRELHSRGGKQVGVFRTAAEALGFLGIDTLDALPPPVKKRET